MSDTSPIFPALHSVFSSSAKEPVTAEADKPRSVPLTIRVTSDEKAQLKKASGALAISAYVRDVLFGDDADTRPSHYSKKLHTPRVDTVEIARLLGTFGRSELATSILALSLLAQTGELDVDDHVSNKMERACDDIHEMKHALIIALGVKPQGQRDA